MELLEREHALQTLHVLLGHAARGSGRIALIGGEAGIGKTALVERFRSEQPHAIRRLWGACDALFTPRPLGLLYDMARHAARGLAAVLNSDADRQAVFEAALNELGHLPTLAVFEDIHWADEATLDLLKFLGRRIEHTSTLLVMTYRDDELGPQHPLRSVLGALAGGPACCRLALSPLSVEAVRHMAGERPIDPRALHRRTGGNPFFVSEVLASDGALPATVRDAVLARAARLSSAARAVLDAAAIIGARVEPWLLGGVIGELQATEECLAGGVLKAQGDMLAFRLELARLSIREAIAPHRRIVLHRAVLDALRSSPLAHSEPSRLAYHADAAGDGAAVLLYAAEAARQAALRCAHREAAELLGLAIRYAADLPAAAKAQLFEQFSLHCSRLDRRSEAIAARYKAIALLHEAGDTARECESYVFLVMMLIQAGQNPAAELASRAAIRLAEQCSTTVLRARAYESQALVRQYDSDYAEADRWCERAITLPDLDHNSPIWRRLRHRRALTGLFFNYELASAELEQMLSEARAAAQLDAGREIDVANLLCTLCSRSVALYRWHSARRYLAEGLAYTAERDFYTLHNVMLAAQSLTELYLGDWARADELACRVLGQHGTSAFSRMPALETIGRLRSRRGETGAEAALAEGLDLALPTGNILRIGPLRAARAEAAWLAGDAQRAAAEGGAAYELALQKREPWIAGELLLWRARAGQQLAIPDWIAAPFRLEVEGDWRAAAGEWQRLGCSYEQARALAEGDEAARRTALALWDRLGARPAAQALRSRMRFSGVLGVPRGPRPRTRSNRYGLTARQTEILALLGENLTNAEIAAQLHLSAKTVDHHVSAVLAKLDVPTRRAAGALAR